MKIYAIPDTAIITGEYVGGGKVGSGGNTPRKVESESAKLTEPQYVTKTTDTISEISHLGVNLKFAVDEETGEHVVKVLNPETGDVIRQFPPEEFLQVIENLRNLKGMLFSTKL